MKHIVKGIRHSSGTIDGQTIDTPNLVIEKPFGRSKFGENFGSATIDVVIDSPLLPQLKALDWSRGKTYEMELEIEELAMGKGKFEATVVAFKVIGLLEYKPVVAPAKI